MTQDVRHESPHASFPEPKGHYSPRSVMLGVTTRILTLGTQDHLSVRRNRYVRFLIVISGASLDRDLRKGTQTEV